MIAVVANPSEHAAVYEFFELFKTPWQFYQPDCKYDVILSTGSTDFDMSAACLSLIYSGRTLPLDEGEITELAAAGGESCNVSYKGFRIPLHGDHVFFPNGAGFSSTVKVPKTTICRYQSGGREIVRIGYDLFAEVRILLTHGQAVHDAAIPALELHIALLRDLIRSSGMPLAEIPPIPHGYQFIACLTHDVDHPMLRRHRFDHTMFGFLYRATVGSLVAAFRGRVPWSSAWKNWWAALKLPFVHLGLASDCWSELARYIVMEEGAPSSFFFIPFQGRPGRSQDSTAPGERAAKYGAADLSGQIRSLMSAGCEIGLHGIDAWHDATAARDELREIRKITQEQEIGVRMHWLYFDENSPATLERAGASYDSTVGYNETIGYRAGTTQAYRPPGTNHLIELPLHVMDTALFFPSHLGLSAAEARPLVGQMIDNLVRFGGCLTVNWHDRSIAPERLWGDFYVDLIAELKARGAWLTTAGEAVAWFRKRRSARFEDVSWDATSLRAKIAVEPGDDMPSLQLLVNEGREQHQVALIGPASSESSSFGQTQTINAHIALTNEMQTAVERN
ncbi:MAG TPA: hypothetical protein VE377_03115 [Candidatus Dormibacteraeota bacterium]|nr:hypothetical protein [Candidatus Dormibacteraeota bacterium]